MIDCDNISYVRRQTTKFLLTKQNVLPQDNLSYAKKNLAKKTYATNHVFDTDSLMSKLLPYEPYFYLTYSHFLFLFSVISLYKHCYSKVLICLRFHIKLNR